MSNQSHGLWINRFQEILHCKWRTNYQIVSYESLRQSIECDQWFKLELFNPGGSEKLWRINTALFWYDNPTFLLMSGDWNEIRTHAFQIPLFQSQWSLRFFKCCFLPKQALDAESWKTVFCDFNFDITAWPCVGGPSFRGFVGYLTSALKIKRSNQIFRYYTNSRIYLGFLPIFLNLFLPYIKKSDWRKREDQTDFDDISLNNMPAIQFELQFKYRTFLLPF